MTNLPKDPVGAFSRKRLLREEISLKLLDLDERQIDLALRFIDQLLLCHDPDVVEDFLEWRSDPNLGSILQLAAAVSGELREQLLFIAEDLYSSQHPRH